MKINRLLEIIIILLNKDTITAKELAERFQVSIRTIYRDVEELSLAGIPVYMSKGKGGGISLLEEYTLHKNILTKEERDNLIVALSSLNSSSHIEMNGTLEKVRSIFGNENNKNWIEVDLKQWGNKNITNKGFEIVKQAILDKIIIEFDYVNTNNIKSRRKVEPYKILYKGQAWYFFGFCLEKEDFRLFKFSRVRNMILCNEYFVLREIEDKSLDQSEIYKPKMVKLVFKFNKNMLYHVYDFYNEDQIRENNDGYIVNVEYPYDEWIYSHILSYGSNIEVLEPDYIREEVKKRIEKMMNVYRI